MKSTQLRCTIDWPIDRAQENKFLCSVQALDIQQSLRQQDFSNWHLGVHPRSYAIRSSSREKGFTFARPPATLGCELKGKGRSALVKDGVGKHFT